MILGLWVVLFVSVFGLAQSQATYEACWEKCYQMIDDDANLKKYRPAFFEMYDMGMEGRRLKNMRSVDGTVYMLDSTLSMWHDPATNPELQSYETADAIWKFQRDLAIITTMMSQNDDTKNPLAFVQFNERAAWTCKEFTCMDTCEASYFFKNDDSWLTPIQLNASSHEDANAEPACRLGYLTLHDTSERTTCTAEIDREMAIAFVNSDFHSHVHESDEWDDYSPCDEHFDTRYAIGTHAAEYHDLKDFSSLDAHAIYLKDSQYTMEAATILSECMMDYCCATFVPPDVPGTDDSDECVITTDHFGENIETMSSHPYYSSGTAL